MNCEKVLEQLEEYIMGELDNETCSEIRGHLEECRTCNAEFEDMKETIDSLHNLKKSLVIKEDVLDMSRRNIVKNANKKRRGALSRALPGVAAAVFFVLFSLSSTIIAFPSFAANYMPELPVVKQLQETKSEFNSMKQEMQEIKQENERIKLENDKLLLRIKEIDGTEITEVVTKDPAEDKVDAAENNAIQQLVMEFIKAQYKGDLETIKSMCTDEFKKEVEDPRSGIIKDNKGEVIFSTITNVAKEGDMYMVFVRLNDTSSNDDADYQENFELKKVDGKFLVSFVGMDA